MPAMTSFSKRRPSSENKNNHLRMVKACLLSLLMTTVGQALSVASAASAFHYEAPSDCQWTLMNSSSASSGAGAGSAAGLGASSAGTAAAVGISTGGANGLGSGLAGSPGAGNAPAGSYDVALHCRLRTINSQFDQTNFSVVPREHTASLAIECSDSLLYQR